MTLRQVLKILAFTRNQLDDANMYLSTELVVRSCGIDTTTDIYPLGCTQKTEELVCVCDSDMCNSALSTQHHQTTVAYMRIAAILLTISSNWSV